MRNVVMVGRIGPAFATDKVIAFGSAESQGVTLDLLTEVIRGNIRDGMASAFDMHHEHDHASAIIALNNHWEA